MFSKTSFKSFTHKAKKGVLTKIGMHEEKQEDPIFQAVLFSVTNFKNELKDMSFKAHGLGNSGTGYNNALEFLCGAGLKGELLFDKEQKFIDSIKQSLCEVLSKIVETDIPEMDALVIKYKGAKLDYDRLYFQTVKDMTKKEIGGTDSREEVHKNNVNLPILRETWEKSKKAVIDQRNVYKGRLDNEVLKALQMVNDVSDAPHHRLYIDYFKARILTTSAMCDSGTVRAAAVPIKVSEVEANDSEEVENEIEYKTSPVQVDQGETKVEAHKSVDELKEVVWIESSIKEVPFTPIRNIQDDLGGMQIDEASPPPARMPPQPPMEEVESPQEPPPQPPAVPNQEPAVPAQAPVVVVERALPPQPPAVPDQEPALPPRSAPVVALEREMPPQPPAVPDQEPVEPPQAPPVVAVEREMPPPPPAVPDQEPVQPPQAPPVVAVEREMPPQPPAVPDQEPAVPRQAPPALAGDRGMPPQPPAVPNVEPVVPPQAPVEVPQPPVVLVPPPVAAPQPPAVPQQPPVGPPQPPAGPPQPPVGPPQPPAVP